MKSGDLVVPKPYNHLQEKFDLYEGENTPFDVKWLKGQTNGLRERKMMIDDIAIVITSYSPNTGGTFYRVITSNGEVGWAHENWLRRIDLDET